MKLVGFLPRKLSGPVYCTALKLQLHATMPGFYAVAGNLDFGPYAYTENMLPTGPSSQPLSLLKVKWIYTQNFTSSARVCVCVFVCFWWLKPSVSTHILDFNEQPPEYHLVWNIHDTMNEISK